MISNPSLLTRYSLLFLIILLSSCSSKKLVYMNESQNLGEIDIVENYDLKIKKDDQLSIIVNSKEPALAAQFNMMLTSQNFTGSNTISTGQAGGSPQKFIVDSEGNINYPMFGKINVEGMSRIQLADSISSMLESNGYIKDPVVNVNIANFKVSVLGEVLLPGTYDITGESITIFRSEERRVGKEC